ncbi:hypothetical protein OROHE_017328 [Orobanche hederae]
MESGSVLNSPFSAHVLSSNFPRTHINFISISAKNFSARFSYSYGTTSVPQLLRLRSYPLTIGQVVENPAPETLTKDMLPNIRQRGRFCSPRAARELALLILYAACLDGSDPVRLLEKRLNSRRETGGYEFDKKSLMEYDHMKFGGPPVTTETAEEADEILRNNQKESDIEAEVLSAPPKLVYSNLILRFTRKLLAAVADKWDSNVLVIDKIAPSNWKNQPASRILEFSVLHLAMSEIAVLGAQHQIVINEAVDLAKRFCDGAAPRIVNGCLRTFVKKLNQNGDSENVKIKQTK